VDNFHQYNISSLLEDQNQSHPHLSFSAHEHHIRQPINIGNYDKIVYSSHLEKEEGAGIVLTRFLRVRSLYDS